MIVMSLHACPFPFGFAGTRKSNRTAVLFFPSPFEVVIEKTFQRQRVCVDTRHIKFALLCLKPTDALSTP